MTTISREFRIPAENFNAMKERIAELNRKAMKLMGQAITLTHVRTEEVPSPTVFSPGRINVYHIVRVEGPQPKLAGWSLVAAMDLVDIEGGKTVIVRALPGESLPEDVRNRTTGCDHCNQNRIRKTVYVVRRTTSEVSNG